MKVPSLSFIAKYALATCCPRLSTRAYLQAWYKNHQDNEFTYLGFQIDQHPVDMMLYQELIFEKRPPFILQTGVDEGGSLLFFATLLDLIDAPKDAVVIGVDNAFHVRTRDLKHPRIRLIEGDSANPSIADRIKAVIPAPHGLVSLDSDHNERHVAAELKIFPQFVGVGGSLVVEDTIAGHEVFLRHGPGPMKAIETFLRDNPNFAQDHRWKRKMLSCHQDGWLVRTR